MIAVSKNGTEVASYRYTAEGYKIEKQTEEGTVNTLFDIQGRLLCELNDSDDYRTFVYAFGKLLAVNEGNLGDGSSERYFLHTDHLGSVIAATDAAGDLVWKDDYTPFGTQAFEDGSRFALFTGKQMDADIGLYYFNMRWYDPETGRFVSEDPARDGVNWYGYCGNNPLRFFDHMGLSYSGDDPYDTASMDEEELKAFDAMVSSLDDDDDGGTGSPSRTDAQKYGSYLQYIQNTYGTYSQISYNDETGKYKVPGIPGEITAKKVYETENGYAIEAAGGNVYYFDDDGKLIRWEEKGLEEDFTLLGLMAGGKVLFTNIRIAIETAEKTTTLQKLADNSINEGPSRNQLLNLFKGRFRVEKGVEAIPKTIQKELGVKLTGAIQKPWHLVVNGKEIPLNPLNKLWEFFK